MNHSPAQVLLKVSEALLVNATNVIDYSQWSFLSPARANADEQEPVSCASNGVHLCFGIEGGAPANE
jgi:hypothetical protein